MSSHWLHVVPAQAASQPSPLLTLVPMFLIFAVFYVVWFLPLRRQQKELAKLVDNLQKGDRVILNSGFFAKVVKVDGENVTVDLADNVRVRVLKRAIGGLEAGSTEETKT